MVNDLDRSDLRELPERTTIYYVKYVSFAFDFDLVSGLISWNNIVEQRIIEGD